MSGVRALDVVIVSLSSLTIFLLPLIALLISHDAIVGEMERGTMLLLLSYPVGRWQVLLGKFVGHLAILAFATLLGYGAAAGALAATGAPSTRELDRVRRHDRLLDPARGRLHRRRLSRQRARARPRHRRRHRRRHLARVRADLRHGLARPARRRPGADRLGGVLNALLLLNPTDVYRLFNLTGSANVSSFSGMAGVARPRRSPPALLAALAAWALVPLALAALAFSRREL